MQKAQFFSSELASTTRVIWICSKAVRIVDAKLRVFKKYKHLIATQHVLLHHESETHYDIFNSSGMHILSCANNIIKAFAALTDEVIETILRKSASKAWSWEIIEELSYKADLRNDNNHVGNVNSAEYRCRSAKTVNKMRDMLMKDTWKASMKCLISQIGPEIHQYIESLLKISIDDTITEQLLDIFIYEEDIMNTLFDFLIYFISSVWKYIVTFIWTVDVNSKTWRIQVSQDLYETIDSKRESLIRILVTRTQKAYKSLPDDLNQVSERILKTASCA